MRWWWWWWGVPAGVPLGRVSTRSLVPEETALDNTPACSLRIGSFQRLGGRRCSQGFVVVGAAVAVVVVGVVVAASPALVVVVVAAVVAVVAAPALVVVAAAVAAVAAAVVVVVVAVAVVDFARSLVVRCGGRFCSGCCCHIWCCAWKYCCCCCCCWRCCGVCARAWRSSSFVTFVSFSPSCLLNQIVLFFVHTNASLRCRCTFLRSLVLAYRSLCRLGRCSSV